MSRTTVTYRGIDFDIDFEYEPGQEAIVWAAPEDCQPGYPAYVEVCRIWHKGTDFTEILPEEAFEDIAQILEGAAA